MKTFQSYQSFYHFVDSTLEWPYIRSAAQEDFLKAIAETSKTRERSVSQGEALFRAQEGHEWRKYEFDGEEDKEACPFCPERMKPLKTPASGGRANPAGIAYLYTADNERTAIAEVRPWVGAHVSVAKLTLVKSVNLVDCTVDERRSLKLYSREPSPKERERAVWSDLNKAFARPVNPNESQRDYVPTQIIAEAFRHVGFDGIIFRSSLCDGRNITLFDPDAAIICACALFRVSSVQYAFHEAGSSPYIVDRNGGH